MLGCAVKQLDSERMVFVSLTRTPAGEVALHESKRHRVRLHASEPVRGECQHQPFLYNDGDLDVIPGGMADTWQQESESSALSLEIEPRLLERAAYELGQRSSALLLAPRHQFREAAIEHIVRSLYAAQHEQLPGLKLFEESLGLALAARLLGAGHAPAPPRGLARPVAQRVLDYIEQHLSEELSLFQLAQLAGRGASQFKVLFKRSTGYSVHEYVVRRRVERARDFVLHSDRSLAQIAFELGFAHQSHMARCMRRVLGVTPGALRRSHDLA